MRATIRAVVVFAGAGVAGEDQMAGGRCAFQPARLTQPADLEQVAKRMDFVFRFFQTGQRIQLS